MLRPAPRKSSSAEYLQRYAKRLQRMHRRLEALPSTLAVPARSETIAVLRGAAGKSNSSYYLARAERLPDGHQMLVEEPRTAGAIARYVRQPLRLRSSSDDPHVEGRIETRFGSTTTGITLSWHKNADAFESGTLAINGNVVGSKLERFVPVPNNTIAKGYYASGNQLFEVFVQEEYSANAKGNDPRLRVFVGRIGRDQVKGTVYNWVSSSVRRDRILSAVGPNGREALRLELTGTRITGLSRGNRKIELLDWAPPAPLEPLQPAKPVDMGSLTTA